MQIVRDLAGYTLGRSDLVRRAMAKKKAAVMEKERQNFVYGNKEEGVPGCISRGIDEKTANHIYDEMIDFARYAFNKSHAAAYAVVAYQTAYLKYYYPVEYMAALMTSVIENSGKVSDYIQVCRKMGIEIVPPDINAGEWDFSVRDGKICYALSAIKSIGRNVILSMVKEREENGLYTSLQDFLERMYGGELNKRAVENLIKSGAMDCIEGNRRQKMEVYSSIMDELARDQKHSMAGQYSLMDFLEGPQKDDFKISFPKVPEYEPGALLAMEKEVLGIYISGHPLESDRSLIEKNITAVSSDFIQDEETGRAKVRDQAVVTVAGMIAAKTVKTTKTNQMMAFLTLEDLRGTLEIIVFPKDYEKYRAILSPDQKIFVKGRVSLGDEVQGKLICEKIVAFSEIPGELWIQFPDLASYQAREKEMLSLLAPWDGKDTVVVYLSSVRQYQKLPPSRNVGICPELIDQLDRVFGKENIKTLKKIREKL